MKRTMIGIAVAGLLATAGAAFAQQGGVSGQGEPSNAGV